MSRDLLSAGLEKLKFRTLSEWLLAATLITGVYYLLNYVPTHLKAGEPVFALANYFLTYAPIQSLNQPAYVVPESVKVWDTPAEIRMQVTTLRSGEQVQALGHFRDWTHVRTLDGRQGWVLDAGLMNGETHQEEERLREAVADLPPQARGHAADVDNIHIEPSRQAAVVAQVNPEQGLEIFARRLVRRPHENGPSDIPPLSSGHQEAWYLVQEGSHAGWILGHRVQLDIPKRISAYAQDTNLVAWLVLDTVNDRGRKIPQYLVADRVGTQTFDFSDIRVLTWWKRKQIYAIAYHEGGLQGYFPILITHQGSVPCFRLRLVDEAGKKYQKVYGLYETITRNMGSLDTWEGDAMPRQLAPRIRERVATPTGTMRG